MELLQSTLAAKPTEPGNFEFDLKEENASEALFAFSKQSGQSVIFDPQIIGETKTNHVAGKMTPNEALEAMLANTSLGYNLDTESGVYVIFRSESANSELSGESLGSTPKAPINNNPKQNISMKNNTNERRLVKWLAGLVSAFTVVAGPINAQEELDEDVLFLSPFVVETSEDVGYLATSTLSGTRIKSNLEDIATTISVITEEFLEDTGATDANNLLIYTTGTEVAGIGGNFTNLSITGNANRTPSDQAERRTTGAGNRIRGLTSADTARNYFISSIPFDSYNLARVEINRGSNAVLFGLGSPSGIINYALKQAEFNTFGEIEARFGSFGSNRLSFDGNVELLDNQLAIRVAAVQDNRKYEQDPAFEDTERIYVAGTYSRDFIGTDDNTWGATTVRVSFEDGTVDANRPRALPPVDLITSWFHPWTDDVLGTVNLPVKPTINNFTQSRSRDWQRGPISDPNDPFADNTRLSIFIVGNLFRNPHLIFPDHTNPNPGDALSGIIGRQGVINRVLKADGTFANSGFDGPTQLTMALREWRGTVDNPGAISYDGLFNSPLVSDDSMFNFRENLIEGPNKMEMADFDVINASIEQLFFNNKAGFELALAEESFEDGYVNLLTEGPRSGLGIDINTVLMDGTPNPNFGRPYIATQPTQGMRKVERENIRFTFFGELDFSEKDNFTRWLGRHLITGLYSKQTTDSLDYNSNLSGAIDYQYGNNSNPLSNQGGWIGSIHYLGPSLADLDTPAGANIPRIQALQLPTPEKATSGQYRLFPNRPTAQTPAEWANASLDIVGDLISGARIASNEVESYAVVLQSYLLSENLVTTVTWRQDDFDFRNNGNAPLDDLGARIIDPTVFNLDDIPESNILTGSEETVTWGFVLKAPDEMFNDGGLISGFAVNYTESSNFQPTAPRTDSFERSIPSPTGETTDYGFTLRMFDDKLSLRATWYETDQRYVGGGGVTAGNTNIINRHGTILENSLAGSLPGQTFENGNVLVDSNMDGVTDFVYYGVDQDYADRYDFTFDEQTGFRVTGDPTFAFTRDISSEGFELEVVYNPLPNWRFLINASQQEAVISEAGGSFREWLDNALIYDTNGDGEGDISIADALAPGGIYSTVQWLENNTLGESFSNFLDAPLTAVEALNGQKTNELRDWKWNAITNYAFIDGPLAGVNVGGAVRWVSAPTIGYEMGETAFGDITLDPTKPIQGEDTLRLDMWVGYTRELLDSKVNWKVQLNVRNLLNDDELIPVSANPDGRITAFRIPVPLVWEIRNTFSF